MSEDSRAYALRLLSQRSYTTRDLERKLSRKEFPADEIARTIQRFTETGLLDDKKFAANFSRAKLTTSSASPRRVRQHLSRKGIASAIADEAIQMVIADEGIDTEAALDKVARRKLAALQGLDPHVQRRRLYGFLARRGYDLDEIRRAVDNALGSRDRAE